MIFALIGIALALGLGWRYLSRGALAAEIPVLPGLERSRPAVAEQITGADREARRRGYSGEPLGRLAMVYHANSFYEHARITYRLAMRVEPEDYLWPYYLGVLEVTTGENERAISFLTRAVELNARLPHAWTRLGQLYFRKEMLEEAEHAFRNTLRLDPNHPHACVGMARVAGQDGRWPEAVRLLEGAVKEHPRYGPAHRYLAIAYGHVGRDADRERHEDLGSDIGLQMRDPLMWELIAMSTTGSVLVMHAQIAQSWGDLDRAEALLRRAVEVAADDPDARLAIGRFLLRPDVATADRLREAQTHLEAGLKLDASYVNTRHDYALVLQALGDTTAAVGQWERILAEEPRHAMALMSLGQVHFFREQYDVAREYYLEGLEIPPDTPFSLGDPAIGHHRLAITERRLGHIEEARDEFTRAVELDPHLIAAYTDHATMLKELGHMEEGVEVYRRGVELNPGNAHLRAMFGHYLQQAQLFEEAHGELAASKSLDPTSARTLAALGYVEYRLGRTEEAVRNLQQARDLEPDFVLAHYHLGVAYLRSGRTRDAIRCFERSLQLQPNFERARHALARARNREHTAPAPG